MAILETQALTRRFKTLTAVDSLNLTVETGEVFGLLGPNGAGKTTVIKMLTTLLPPTSGHARIAGFDIARQATVGPAGDRLRSANDLSGWIADGVGEPDGICQAV